MTYLLQQLRELVRASCADAFGCKPNILRSTLTLIVGLQCAMAGLTCVASNSCWARHVIDECLVGADGVRLGDINGDGLTDMTTGWEEAGKIRVYVNPGCKKVKDPWPAVTVGSVASPEDAVFADLNGDGQLEVVSSCEGKTRALFVHWAPEDSNRLLDPSAWTTELFPAADRSQMWMYAVPYVSGSKTCLVAGAKGQEATVTLFEPPEHGSARLAEWKSRRLYSAGWIMSVILEDVSRDGIPDVLISDRKGAGRGVFWLQAPPSAGNTSTWFEHRIGLDGREVMFIDFADLNGDTRGDVVAAVKPREIKVLFQPQNPAARWNGPGVELPKSIGTAKAVKVGDVDLDGKPDVVFSCEEAQAPKSGVVWVRFEGEDFFGKFSVIDISGPEGVKFDRLELLDLDGDGDLDVVTCEESANLGVVWYENPRNSN